MPKRAGPDRAPFDLNQPKAALGFAPWQGYAMIPLERYRMGE